MSNPKFSKVLVALDRTIMDGFILEYLSKFHDAYGIEEIQFLHSIKKMDTSIGPEEYAGLGEVEEDIKSELEKSVASFDFGKTNVRVVTKQGSPTDSLLRVALEEKIDLIVMGRKRSLEGSGIVSSHIARKSPTAILFVTQYINPSLKKILVPLDFSEHSKLALNVGGAIEERSEAKLSAINIFDVPLGYYKIGKTYNEFAQIMEGNARKDYEDFRKMNGIEKEYDCHFTAKQSASKIDIVFQHAIALRSDLIIIGSQGRTNSSAMLLGSFAEKMVFKDTDIPVLIMKKEGENMGILEALMAL